MTIILESAVTAAEHRCEALTISDIPPYRCTTSATADRQGHAVCPAHSRALRIRDAVCLKHDRAVWIEYVKITP
jgi:hypothetical protein